MIRNALIERESMLTKAMEKGFTEDGAVGFTLALALAATVASSKIVYCEGDKS